MDATVLEILEHVLSQNSHGEASVIALGETPEINTFVELSGFSHGPGVTMYSVRTFDIRQECANVKHAHIHWRDSLYEADSLVEAVAVFALALSDHECDGACCDPGHGEKYPLTVDDVFTQRFSEIKEMSRIGRAARKMGLPG